MNKTTGWIGRAALSALLMISAGVSLAEVYKSVDKDGNVIYSDQPPEAGAAPMPLPGISVVESVPAPQGPASVADGEPGTGQALDIRQLRRMYRDFAIVSPQPDEYIQGTGNSVAVSWAMREPPQTGMTVIPILDGSELQPVTAFTVTLQDVPRGEHVVGARLVDAERRTIAAAPPVTFYMRQFSANFQRGPRPTPTPGGG